MYNTHRDKDGVMTRYRRRPQLKQVTGQPENARPEDVRDRINMGHKPVGQERLRGVAGVKANRRDKDRGSAGKQQPPGGGVPHRGNRPAGRRAISVCAQGVKGGPVRQEAGQMAGTG